MMGQARSTQPLPFDLRLFLFVVQLAFAAAVYAEMVGHSTIAMVGSYNLTTAEPVLAFSMATTLVLVLRRPATFDVRVLLLVMLAVLTLVSFARGLLVSPYDAFFSLRANGPFTAMILVACLLPVERRLWDTVEKTIILAGLVLSALVFLRLMLGPTFLIQAQYLDESTINDGGRALSAQGAMIVGGAGLLQLRRACRGERLALIPICALMPALLLSRQATASIASVTAAVTFLALQPGPSRPIRVLSFGFLVFIAVFFLTIIPSVLDPETLESIAPKAIIGDALRRAQTLDSRQLVWAGLMRDFFEWSFESQALGLPAGVKPIIVIPLWGGTIWKNSIHSMYFGLLPQVGAVGLGLYLAALLAFALRSLFVMTFYPQQDRGPLIAGLIVLLSIFGFSYELRGEAAVFFLIMAQLARKRVLGTSQPVSSERKAAINRGYSYGLK